MIFDSPLHYERLTEKWVMLLDDLNFHFTMEDVLGAHRNQLNEILDNTGLKHDDYIHVCAPKGFVTDLASIPKGLRAFFKPDGPHAPAAVIHDILYQSLIEKTIVAPDARPVELLNKYHTRLLADRIFLQGMRVLGVNPVKRTLMYNGVRLGGSSSFGGTDTKADYGVFRACPPAELGMYQIFRGMEDLDQHKHMTELESRQWDYYQVQYKNLKRPFLIQTTFPKSKTQAA